MPTIAVLLTCHNRKEKTANCLDALLKLKVKLDIYLVDDKSTDGLKKYISKKFPNVKIINGDGNLFWNRGMHLAWKHASKKNYDFYFWLNNDVVLYKNSMKEMFECSKKNKDKAIVSGILDSSNKKKIEFFGSFDEKKKMIKSNGTMQKVTRLSGHFIVVPSFVFKKLGNLDSKFHHAFGDVDYGFRAQKKNIKIFTTRAIVGNCAPNSIVRHRLFKSNIIGRYKFLFSPLGESPKQSFYFRRIHFGIAHALVYCLMLLFTNLLPDIIYKNISNKNRG
jgi:GT2 family glycosyltransferase|tara:strand:- start:393 stop:1226 length:834 start_codon:yes stop_codon:yes gene_type:complete